MRRTSIKRHDGYVLLLTLLVFMGIGGVVLANFTKEARRDLEARKYEHNRQVLEEAKQALLMYAYNYAQNNPGRGPGRLPCPDTDNDQFGLPNPSFNCVNVTAMVGRFPWGDPDIHFYERAFDASNEDLWYVVSSNFANTQAGTDVVNSDTPGTITLLNQAGELIYDGETDGIAAIIIAPGERLRRDNDGDGIYEYTQVRRVPIEQTDPRNYLDTYTVVDIPPPPNPPVIVATYDNSEFTNGESNSDDDGLLLGPIYDPVQRDYVVNDQMIFITSDEIDAMAEKAVLDTYRNTIEQYRAQIWGNAADRRYPWLAAYDVTTELATYDPQPGAGSTSGRVPFLAHYTDADSPHSVITDLQIDFDITLNFVSLSDSASPLDPGYPGVVDGNYVNEANTFSGLFTGFPAGTQTLTITRSKLKFDDERFNGVGGADNTGTMVLEQGGTATVTAAPSNVVTRYFWDEPGGAANGWELCPVITGFGTDCARDLGLGAFVPYDTTNGWVAHGAMRIRKLTLQLSIDPDFVVELDYSSPDFTLPSDAEPALQPGAAANARFIAEFDDIEVPFLSVADPDPANTLKNFIDLEVLLCDQDNNVGSNLNLASFADEPGGTAAAPDSGTVACSVDLVPNATATVNGQFVITTDWYPQLPRWVADNRWDDAMMMSYAADHAPGGDGLCTPDDGNALTGGATDDCLLISNFGGPLRNNVEALLVLAGEHDLIDGDDLNDDGDTGDAGEDPPDNDFANDLQDIFEPENYSGLWPHPLPNNDPTPASDTNLPLVFDKREENVPGNADDTIFIIN